MLINPLEVSRLLVRGRGRTKKAQEKKVVAVEEEEELVANYW